MFQTGHGSKSFGVHKKFSTIFCNIFFLEKKNLAFKGPLSILMQHGHLVLFWNHVLIGQHFWQAFLQKDKIVRASQLLSHFSHQMQGAKKVIFTACHSGKLKLTFTSPNIISTSPKNILMSRLISQFFCNLKFSKNFTCPSGKLGTKFTSLMAKSTSPGLLDTTFFARWSDCTVCLQSQ